MADKNILVIGAHSYIAQNFENYAKKKKKNWNITLVSASDGAWEKADFSVYDTVLITAALVHRKKQKGTEELYRKVNQELPVRITKRAKEAGIKQVIFLSSMSVFGDNVERITKDTIPNPSSLYGKYKYKAEQVLEKFQSEEFRIAIVRPPMVYGEGCPGNYGRLKKLAKVTWIFPDTQNKRSMIAIEGLCRELGRIVENMESGYFHPQDEEYINTAEMVQKMRAEMGKKTYLTGGFNWILKPLSKKVGIFRKVFGSMWYE